MQASLLSLAEDAARQAAAPLKGLLDRPVTVDSDTDRDIKLAADRDSEQLIIDILRKGSGYSVLSEESGWIGGEQPTRWIVDPLDGSFNYLRGIPVCCVSIGLWRDHEPLLGVIHDIHRDEVFAGIVGEGAWLGERRLRVSSVSNVAKAVLCTGYPVGTDLSRPALAEYMEHVRNYKKIRLLGSAALSLAYVAAGRADAYYERDIKVWDVAAGVALVKAAGGDVACGPLDSRTHALTVDATNGQLARAEL